MYTMQVLMNPKGEFGQDRLTEEAAKRHKDRLVGGSAHSQGGADDVGVQRVVEVKLPGVGRVAPFARRVSLRLRFA